MINNKFHLFRSNNKIKKKKISLITNMIFNRELNLKEFQNKNSKEERNFYISTAYARIL